jgi:hypothetical protein
VTIKTKSHKLAVIEGRNISLSGKLSLLKLAELFEGATFDEAEFRRFMLINVAAAKEINKASGLEKLSVWSGITRPALNELIGICGIKEISVFEFSGIGRLRNFSKAADLEVFRCLFSLKTHDIFELARLPKLHTLTAHCSQFGLKAVEKINQIQTLHTVDFEAVTFSLEMVRSLAKSTSIKNLMLPATGLTRRGLDAIGQMQQLTYLDIWANGFIAEDLDALVGHPSLEKIELGGMEDSKEFMLKASDVIPKLEKMPALKTVHFENVLTTDEEALHLKSRYEFKCLNG